jgi:hypothetical protein
MPSVSLDSSPKHHALDSMGIPEALAQSAMVACRGLPWVISKKHALFSNMESSRTKVLCMI